MISQQKLKELLAYDPSTGLFHWRVDRWRSKKGDVAGWMRPDGYICICIDQTDYRAHRLAWFYVYGEWPLRKIDHADHCRANNRIENLRLAYDVENGRSNVGHSDGRSGRKGVTWNAATGNWRAQIYVGGKQKYLGLFADLNDAARAYDMAAEKLFGEFAATNASLGKMKQENVSW